MKHAYKKWQCLKVNIITGCSFLKEIPTIGTYITSDSSKQPMILSSSFFGTIWVDAFHTICNLNPMSNGVCVTWKSIKVCSSSQYWHYILRINKIKLDDAKDPKIKKLQVRNIVNQMSIICFYQRIKNISLRLTIHSKYIYIYS